MAVRGVLLGLAFCLLGTAARAQTARSVLVRDTAELQSALRALSPGTVVRLAPGEYQGGLYVGSASGTPEQPIRIESAVSDKPARIVGGPNGIHLSKVAHLEIRDIHFARATGNGLNIDDGGDLEHPSHHVELRDLVVEDVGASGNQDGIKLSGVTDFRVENCKVERWGAGGSAIDMVGCKQGEIVNCHFRHTRDDINANGVQAKGGSTKVAIRGCRFEHAGSRAINLGGSTGRQFFRPRLGIDAEARDLLVEDCTIVGSMAAVAFVGVDGAIVRRNLIYRPRRWVLRILQENQDPSMVPARNGQFLENIIMFRSGEIATTVNAGGGTKPQTFRFEGNSWYCEDQPARSEPRLPVAELRGIHGVNPGFKDAEAGDFRREPPE